jgi:hypothetical protein
VGRAVDEAPLAQISLAPVQRLIKHGPLRISVLMWKCQHLSFMRLERFLCQRMAKLGEKFYILNSALRIHNTRGKLPKDRVQFKFT